MKRFYLFTRGGITARFFCGNVYEALPADTINYNDEPMTFQECLMEGLCVVFDSRKEANQYSESEDKSMDESNSYAREAMDSEEYYGCEGVDDCRWG